MAGALLFPSRAWCEAAAEVLLADEEVQVALAEFGPVTAGLLAGYTATPAPPPW